MHACAVSPCVPVDKPGCHACLRLGHTCSLTLNSSLTAHSFMPAQHSHSPSPFLPRPLSLALSSSPHHLLLNHPQAHPLTRMIHPLRTCPYFYISVYMSIALAIVAASCTIHYYTRKTSPKNSCQSEQLTDCEPPGLIAFHSPPPHLLHHLIR